MKIGGVEVAQDDPNFGHLFEGQQGQQQAQGQQQQQQQAGGGGDDTAILTALKARGIEVDSLDKIAVKKDKPVEITEEQLLNAWVKQGKKAEEFAEVKSLLNADPETLSKTKAIAQLKEYGLTDEQAEQYYKSQYFVDDAENSFLTDEQKELGKKMREKIAESAKAEAKKQLDAAKNFIQMENERLKQREIWEKQSETTLAAMRQLSFEVGEGMEKTNMGFEISDEDFSALSKELGTPEKMLELIMDENGHKQSALAELLVWKKLGPKIVQAAFNEGVAMVSAKLGGVLPGHFQPTGFAGGKPLEAGKTKAAEHNQKVLGGLFSGKVVRS